VRETEQNFVITAHLPGVDRSQIETTVQDDNIVIEARRNASTPEGWKPVYVESRPADYRLVLGTDHRVNRNAIDAELTQGVLTLTVPKAESLKPRRIEIKG
jgi:HSP20 family molecular chaperone IbpA